MELTFFSTSLMGDAYLYVACRRLRRDLSSQSGSLLREREVFGAARRGKKDSSATKQQP